MNERKEKEEAKTQTPQIFQVQSSEGTIRLVITDTPRTWFYDHHKVLSFSGHWFRDFIFLISENFCCWYHESIYLHSFSFNS